MVRLWTWEAFAHGAETVCYFRWRQAPFGQEQLHAGLLRPDGAPAPGLAEAATVAREIAALPEVGDATAPVALVFDYESAWAWAAQPQGADFDYFRLCFDFYRALRRLGVDVDILPPDAADLSRWRLVLAPGLFTLSAPLRAALSSCPGVTLFGPRANARTPDFALPAALPPDLPGLDVRVARLESLPPEAVVALEGGGCFRRWAEELEGAAAVLRRRADGSPALVGQGGLRYLGGWPDDATLLSLLRDLCAEVGVATLELPEGLRKRDCGKTRFWFNHAAEPVVWGGLSVPPAAVRWDVADRR
jgi:beta-galactosidase